MTTKTEKSIRVKVTLKDVGRDNYCGEFFTEGTIDIIHSRIYNELTKYLLSSEIEFDCKLNGDFGDVVVGGFRTVGKIKIEEIKE